MCKSPEFFPQVWSLFMNIYHPMSNCMIISITENLYLHLLIFQSTPKPVLTLLDLSFPLASSDLGADNLENEFMMTNMHLSQASSYYSIDSAIL